MRRKFHHSAKYVVKENLEKESIKAVLTVLAVELGLLLFAMCKGVGANYLPVTALLMGFTIFACGFVLHFKADKYLIIVVLTLLNFGFVVQAVQSGSGLSLGNFFLKFSIAIISALSVSFLYQSFADLLSKDIVIKIMMALQIGICISMFLVGGGAGARINIGGFTLFEVVKVLSPFIMAGLLCKEETSFSIGKWSLNREVVLIIDMVVLSLFFVACSELGTLLVIFVTGLMMLFIFGKCRIVIHSLIVLFVTSFGSLWIVCEKILLPIFVDAQAREQLLQGLPSFLSIEKVVERFGSALHPEWYWGAQGHQGLRALQALTMGGMLGLDTERHRIQIPLSYNDMVFANLIQTCGFFMGIIVIFCFFFLLKRGITIASRCQDSYFQGLTMAITLLIIVETIIHIGYNIAMFPITGIPLYFVSQGFLAIITSMVLIAILLVISTGKVKRRGR